MQKLFVDSVDGERIVLDGESARHIAKSLRMRVGDMICVTDGGADDYGCQIEEITRDEVVLKVCYKQACESEPTCRVTNAVLTPFSRTFSNNSFVKCSPAVGAAAEPNSFE